MSSNQQKRKQLEEIYGKGSMFQKARTQEYLASFPRIKGIMQYVQN